MKNLKMFASLKVSWGITLLSKIYPKFIIRVRNSKRTTWKRDKKQKHLLLKSKDILTTKNMIDTGPRGYLPKKQPINTICLIQFASRTLKSVKRNYMQIKKKFSLSYMVVKDFTYIVMEHILKSLPTINH